MASAAEMLRGRPAARYANIIYVAERRWRAAYGANERMWPCCMASGEPRIEWRTEARIKESIECTNGVALMWRIMSRKLAGATRAFVIAVVQARSMLTAGLTWPARSEA